MMSTTATLDIETRVKNALDACILKIAQYLDRNFDPKEKQSLGLFRQLCSALRTRVHWVKSFLKPNAQFVAQPPKTDSTNKKDKKESVRQRESPIINALIDETRRFGDANNNQKTKNGKINGLLKKF